MKKTAQEPKVTENPLYHDTWMLLRKYRDVVWSLELSVQQVIVSWGVLKAWLTPCSVMRAPWVATSACAVSVTIARFLSARTAAGRAPRTAG